MTMNRRTTIQMAAVIAVAQTKSEKGEIEVVQYALLAEIDKTSGTTVIMMVLLI